MRWKDAPGTDIPLFASRYPRLAERLGSAPERKERFWFTLEEDEYDLLLGDKLVRYFEGAVFEREDAARAYAAARARERGSGGPSVRYAVKSFEIRLDESALAPSGHEPAPGEDYYIEKILDRIEETLASEGRQPWGMRYPGW